jgi:tetratricopeptide (TPR) repeat protein
MIFALFSYPFSLLQFQVIFVFLIAIISSFSKPIFQIPIAFNKLKTWYSSSAILLTPLIVFNLYFYAKEIVPYSEAYLKWDKTLKYFYNDKQCSIANLYNLYPCLKSNPEFLYTYGKALNIMERYAESDSVLKRADLLCPSYETLIELGISNEKRQEYQKAKGYWAKASLMIPSRLEPDYLIAKMYFDTGDYDNARNLTKKLKNKSPKIYSPEVYELQDKIKNLSRKINSLNKNHSINH